MDIAALSMNMAQSNVMQAVSAKMLSNAMDMADVAGDAITSMMDSAAMELSVNPSVGANFDVMV
ncbi:MAG: YjfB family protein [Lachnospiraceae bacterium]|nr:YjfB family protein [Lachnospiraceae bacterium]